jgi:N-methylhydantoinase B/oxoprolinase/acetone carboxylase alpha subunit
MPQDVSFIEERRYRPEPMSDLEARCIDTVSHEDYSVYTQRLASACDEGKEMLVRLGISEPLQSGDVCHAYYTSQGDLSLAELGTFLHAITGAVPVKFVLKHYKDDPTVGLQDGDIFFCNEAIYGGLHNPDQIVFMPVFWKGELISWVSSAGHEPETGATEPGGQPADAKDRYAEGLKVPPVRIGENFKLRRDMMEFFQNMVRYPEMIATDTAAKLAACLRLRARLLEIVERHGTEFVVGLLRKVIEDSAAAARDRVSKLPEGRYRCMGFLDTYGPAEALLRVPCTMRKKGEKLIVEFAGASPQLPGPFNAFEHVVYAHLVCMLFQYFFSDLPGSAGTLEAFEVRCEKGTFLNADIQAAVSSGTAMGPMPGNVFMMCLTKAMYASQDPDTLANIALPPGACARSFFFGGINQFGKEVAGVSLRPSNTAGLGARPDKDAVDAGSFWWVGRGNAVDVEHEEALNPYLVEYSNFAPDNAGPGMYQGGAGMSYGIRVHNTPEFYVQTFGLASRIPTNSGLFGGYAANVRPAIRIIGGDGEESVKNGAPFSPRNEFDLIDMAKDAGLDLQLTPAQQIGAIFKEGDFIGVSGPGGAGYGDVLERDPESVAADVARGVISVWTAEKVYCVVFDDEQRIDSEATLERRDEERRQRLKQAVPYREFVDEWSKLKPPDDALELYGEWPGTLMTAVESGENQDMKEEVKSNG